METQGPEKCCPECAWLEEMQARRKAEQFELDASIDETANEVIYLDS